MITSPEAAAASSASSPRSSVDAARRTTESSPVSSAAASSSSDCTGAGSSRLRSRNACSTRVLRCSCSGSGVDPPSWSGLSPVGSSSRASGLPPLAAISRPVTSGATPGRWSRSSRAAAGSSPRSCRSGMPSGRNGVEASSRAENTRSTRSAPSRRAQNTSASAVAESSQCASSTTHSTVFSSAAVVSRDNVATATRKGSTGGPSSSPNTTRRARACGPGSPSRSRFNGSSSRCRAAKASGASTSSPWVRRTVTSPASVTSASSSADLPTPGSPCTTRLAEPPCRACWSSSFRCAVSRSRPTSTQ